MRSGLLSRLRVGQWFVLVGAVIGLLTLAAILVGALAIVRLSDARELVVEKLDPATTSVLQLSAALVNQETGVRGYALTGQRSLLAPYVEGRRAEQAASRRLRRLVEQEEAREVVADLARVRRAAREWQATYAEPTIAAVRPQGSNASRTASDAGRQSFDVVRRELRRAQVDLRAAREEALEQFRSAADFLPAAFAAIAIVLLLGGVAVVIALRRTVSAPLARVASQARRTARGAFDRKIVGDGPRDIVELADDVDTMRLRIVQELASLQQAHARLDRQAQELGRSNAELEQFAYVASHDLQEPLRKVASFCQLLEQRYAGQLDERADRYIEFAVDGAKRMQQLINDLLAFSRVGRMTTETTTVDLDDVLAEALANLATAIEETGAEIDVESLPTVRGEHALLVAVFQNLVGNALKFVSPGIPPRVEIRVRREREEWELSCTDNGIGIDAEYAERIFLIFQRLHPKDVYAGTGIGLAMCRKIIEFHGGRIWLDPDGDGTSFRFTLPAIEETR